MSERVCAGWIDGRAMMKMKMVVRHSRWCFFIRLLAPSPTPPNNTTHYNTTDALTLFV